jgi:hypothetical protein
MLISNEWLKDYVDAGVKVEDLAERITQGIEHHLYRNDEYLQYHISTSRYGQDPYQMRNQNTHLNRILVTSRSLNLL